MSGLEETYSDRPVYDVQFLRYVAAGSVFIMSPVFILLMLTESAYAIWIGLLWLAVPACIFVVPYLLVIPALITMKDTTLVVRHGKWTMRFPNSIIDYEEIVQAPPTWVNNHYMFPSAQWVHIRKTKGIFKSWYIPATSATRLILAIRKMRERE